MIDRLRKDSHLPEIIEKINRLIDIVNNEGLYKKLEINEAVELLLEKDGL